VKREDIIARMKDTAAFPKEAQIIGKHPVTQQPIVSPPSRGMSIYIYLLGQALIGRDNPAAAVLLTDELFEILAAKFPVEEETVQ
jgi:hypothetical protein